MNLPVNFLSSQKNSVSIQTSDPEIVNHFALKENNTQFIIDQFDEIHQYLEPLFNDRKDLCVIDIGANIGLFSLWISDSCSQVFAVEPYFETFKILSKLTANNSNITNFNVAISDRDGMTSFFLNENSTTNSLLNRGGEKIDIPCLSLFSLINEIGLKHIDLVKMDIEGSEMLVLNPTVINTVRDNVFSFYIEVHQTDIQLRPWPGNLEQNRDFIALQFINTGYNVLILDHEKIFCWRK